MADDSGLPDYVADHFTYLVRSSFWSRLGQAIFMISGVVNPVMLLLALPDADGNAVLPNLTPLVISALVFAASFVWYLFWFESRRRRYRDERPASYARWYGGRGRPLTSRNIKGQLRLIKMQVRYVFLGKEPSNVETLALTMRFVRNSA